MVAVEGLLACEFLSMAHLPGDGMHAAIERATAAAAAGGAEPMAAWGSALALRAASHVGPVERAGRDVLIGYPILS